MANNKFIDKQGNVLLDLTGDTVTADKVVTGHTFHGKDGAQSVGTYAGIIPSGKLEITDLQEHDVANKAKAQIVDANLVAANIKKDVVVLGITGTHEGVSPSGSLAISTPGSKDVSQYASAYIDVANIANLEASNILEGVTILGVVGTAPIASTEGNAKLNTPTIQLGALSQASDNLYIYNNNNGNFVTYYDIYKDGVLLASVGGSTSTVTVNLRNYITTDGSYSITVKARGTGMDDSDASTAVSYTHYTYATITNNLTHCTSNNTAQSIVVGNAYTATLVAEEGYSFRGATISVMMNGVDVTSSVFNEGVISISQVTGNITITASYVTIVKLATPSISDNNTGIITISAVPNATSYGIYANGAYKTSTTSLTFNLNDLTFAARDTYSITVKAQASGYADSDASNVVSFEYTGSTVDPVFGNNDWSTIFSVDQAQATWALGDYKESTVDNVNVRIRIADLTANRYADNNNGGNHGVLEILWKYDDNTDWKAFYPTRKMMNSSGSNAGGWNASEMRTWLNSTFKGLLASDLQAAITKNYSIPAMNGGSNATGLTYSSDQIILASEKEIFGSASYAASAEANVTSQYGIYAANNNSTFRIKYRGDTGAAYSWWLRSTSQVSTTNFVIVNYNGSVNGSSANIERGVVPFIPF